MRRPRGLTRDTQPGLTAQARQSGVFLKRLNAASFLVMAAELGELITVTPGVRSGKACVTGTRITVSDVLGY